MQAGLSQRQKAAVIVRLLLDDDDGFGLDRLDDDSQTLLAQAMAGLELVDRQTRDAIIDEFCNDLEAVGVTFPGNIDGTLRILGEKLSLDSTDRLRRLAAMSGAGDPWQRISTLPREAIRTLALTEPTEVVALMLSKLPVGPASAAFTALPLERAHEVARAMSLTGGVSAQALRRVGLVLLQSVEALPKPAIDTPAADRVGALLNFASADLRDSVLEALESADEDFAGGVRKAIFIFAHIPDRILPRDVPRIVREVEQPVLIRALLARQPANAAAAEFILSNLSQRMAEGLRDEMETAGKVSDRDSEAAMTEVIAAIRRLEEAGELALIQPELEE